MPRLKLFDEEMYSIGIRIPMSLKREIEKLARQERRSLNQEIIRLLERGVEIEKQPASKGKPSAR